MALRNWHFGKLIILWGWTVVAVGVGVTGLGLFGGNYLVGLLCEVLIVSIPAVMSVVTWKWLTGKEQK